MPKVNVSDNIYRLLFERAKRENRTIDYVVNELMNKALWAEPGQLFKGRRYIVESDIFSTFEPKAGELEP